MATYVIGDLHGRLDFLQNALKDANYSSEKDRLFILGDIIDGTSSKASYIALLAFIRDDSSITLLRGNHEREFCNNASLLEFYLFDKSVRDDFLQLINCSIRDSLHILPDLGNCRSALQLDSCERVKKWIHEVKRPHRRLGFLNAWSKLAFSNTQNELQVELLSKLLFWILQYKVLNFIKELCSLNRADFQSICTFLDDLSSNVELKIQGRDYYMTHWIGDEHIPIPVSGSCRRKTILQGHVSAQRLWKHIGAYRTTNQLLPIWDLNSNIHLLLDLEPQGCVLLRLEDMSEFYWHDVPTRQIRHELPAQPWPHRKMPYRTECGFKLAENYGVILDREAYKWTYELEESVDLLRYCPCINLFNCHPPRCEYYKNWITAHYSGPNRIEAIRDFIEEDFRNRPSKGIFTGFLEIE